MRSRKFLLLPALALLVLVCQRVSALAVHLRSSFETVAAAPGAPPIRLHIIEAGNGPPLVLLHGIGGSAYSFRHFLPVLARTHRVLAIDLKGFGRSDKPTDGAYGTSDHAALVAAVLRKRRLEGVTIVGHSYGGTIALHLALALDRTEPQRIGRLVLMGAPAYPQKLGPVQRLLSIPLLPYLTLGALPPILATRHALATATRRMPPATEFDAIAYAEPLYESGGRHALIETTRLIVEKADHHATPRYERIRQPTLLMWCRHDPTVPSSTGERLARTLPRARLVRLDGCEHTPNEESPLEALRYIGAFLRR